MNKKLAKRAEETLRRLDPLIRHIRSVQENALVLGEKLIKNGDVDLGQKLIANSFIHDNSKFFSPEFEELTDNQIANNESSKLRFKMALASHLSKNMHHPEFWTGGIKAMNLVYLLELLCDWKSRSEQFGTSLIEYINGPAMKRFDFDKNDEVYKTLIKYHDLLCEKPFVESK